MTRCRSLKKNYPYKYHVVCGNDDGSMNATGDMVYISDAKTTKAAVKLAEEAMAMKWGDDYKFRKWTSDPDELTEPIYEACFVYKIAKECTP